MEFIFIVSFLATVAFYRGMFLLFPKVFNDPWPKLFGAVNVHHYHLGIIILLVSNIVLILGEEIHTWIVLALGLGFGIVLDEFTTTLLLPRDRTRDISIYKKSTQGTLLIFIVITIVVLIF